MRAANPHTNLARRVSAYNRTVVHKQHLRAVTRRGDRGEKTGGSRSDNTEIGGMLYRLEPENFTSVYHISIAEYL